MATRKTDQTDQTDGQENGQESTERNAQSTGQGRKKLCGYDLGENAKCELWAGHEGDHMTVDITTDDLEMSFIPEDEIASLVRAPAVRSAEQIAMDKNVSRVYAEWVKRGSDKEKLVWASVHVAPHKVRKIKTYLRNAADQHELDGKRYPVQLRFGDDKFRDGGIVIPFTVLERRKYEKKDAQESAPVNA